MPVVIYKPKPEDPLDPEILPEVTDDVGVEIEDDDNIIPDDVGGDDDDPPKKILVDGVHVEVTNERVQYI